MSANSTFVQLILPGLLPLSSQQLESTSLLNRFLARAKATPAATAAVSHASLSYLHDFSQLPETTCWRCDPVYIRPDATQAILFDLPEGEVSATEAQALTQSFNEHFAEQQLNLEYTKPGRWYLQGLKLADIEPPLLQDVVGCNLQPLMQQADVKELNRLLTEIQMLFYQHPINIDREAKGLLPINGVWVYGAAELSNKENYPWQRIISDSVVYQGLAQYLAVPHVLLNEQINLQEHLSATESIVLQTNALAKARSEGFDAWLQAIANVEQHYLAPLWSALKRGDIQAIRLQGAQQDYELTRLHTYKVWQQRYKQKELVT